MTEGIINGGIAQTVAKLWQYGSCPVLLALGIGCGVYFGQKIESRLVELQREVALTRGLIQGRQSAPPPDR